MPQGKNRELIPITSQAHRHLHEIVKALRATGLSTSMTAYATELILSQPIPNHKPQAAGIKQPRPHIRVRAAGG